MSGTLTLEESKSLLALCRSGRLHEIEDWIRAGKSLAVAAGIRKTPLELAIETGFHSLIVLLARNEPRREVKNKALADAVGRRKLDMIELLVDQGADVSSIAFVDVLRTWDPKIIRYFLDRGADVVADRPFAVAFGERVRSSLRVFKECQESHPEIAGELKQQAERA